MATGCAFKRVEPQWQSQLERLINNAQYSQFAVNYLGSQVVDVGRARRLQVLERPTVRRAKITLIHRCTTAQTEEKLTEGSLKACCCAQNTLPPSSLSYRLRYMRRCGPTSEHMPINREG